ncbi:hypothetical protein C5167_021643 [Papaver somniferum]|nr:hypothetical protein C5167_021643 [Papaver somniferum]
MPFADLAIETITTSMMPLRLKDTYDPTQGFCVHENLFCHDKSSPSAFSISNSAVPNELVPLNASEMKLPYLMGANASAPAP